MTKVRSLLVRPIQSVDLAFATSGVLGFHNRAVASLGSRVDAVDKERALAARFGKASAANPATIELGPSEMRAALGNDLLFALDQGDVGVDLAAAIARRAHAWLARFQAKTALLRDIRELYPANPQDPSVASRLSRLERMRALMDEKHQQLVAAYGQAPSVITSATTVTQTTGKTETEVRTRPLGLRSGHPTIKVSGGGPDVMHTPQGTADSLPIAYQGGKWEEPKGESPDTFTEKISTAIHPSQSSSTQLVELRHPGLEEKIEHERAHLALQDEWLRARSFQAQSPHLEKIWDLELETLDLDVARLQHQFSQGLLFSPIQGTVTAIYKDLGEHVSAGEPILRIENDREVLVVGTLQHTNAVTIGMKAKITTSDLFEAGDKVEMAGKVVSVRGHDADNDEWEVIIAVDNEGHDRTLANGSRDRVRLPINYHFDKDQTLVELRL
ncbi:MAG TPA: HlyD family secretion protein [Labilithrix sp.]|nr:HlyD family secretion protein [Labilithrix sp.]